MAPRRDGAGTGDVATFTRLTAAVVATLLAATIVLVARSAAGAPLVEPITAAATAQLAAVRHPHSVVAPAMPEPAKLTLHTQANALTFNNCTANRVHDDRGLLLGITGAAHCVRSSGNVMRTGFTFGTGPARNLPRASISIDPFGDIFYVGLDGKRAREVHDQLILNHRRADLPRVSPNATMVMSGYPAYNNSAGAVTTIPLAYGGPIVWPEDPRPAIGTFGNWTDTGRSCSPRASGSGLYALVPGLGFRIIGVLSSRAEFDHVQTMPYPEEYGAELRIYFERQLDRTITASYLCGFTPPGP